MFNPDKVLTIITHVQTVLDKQNSYAFYCVLKESEFVELSKHFTVTEDGEFNNMKKYIFTKK